MKSVLPIMNKEKIYQYLDECKIAYEVFEHPAVYTVAQANNLNLPYPEAGAKNLFLRDDKKRNYYLLTVRDTAPVDFKSLRQKIGSRRLTMASETDLEQILHLSSGSVTPLGLLNDTRHSVQFLLDSSFLGHRIGIHPNENTATVYLKTDDLLTLLDQNGINPVCIDFA